MGRISLTTAQIAHREFTRMSKITGGEAVYETLASLGVEHVFGIVSVHNIPIYDAIGRGFRTGVT